ncbi:MAG: aldo/keto reductase [Dermatophilaceae bacterium]
MRTTPLGHTGIEVSAVAFGTMALSPGVYGPAEEAESIATIHAALDAGVTFIDTARLYGGGTNEVLVGKALAGRRDEVTLATKGGLTTGADGQITPDGAPATLRRHLDASLAALEVESVDLYYLHSPDPSVPVAESVGAMAEFVAEGKVRFLGVSNCSVPQLREAAAVHPIAATQDQYSLLWRRPETEGRIAALDELGVTLVAWSPLGGGVLAGAVPGAEPGDMRSWMPRFAGAEGERVAGLSSQFRSVAARERIAPSTLALAWLSRHREPVVPLAGTRKVANIASIAAAADVDLSAELSAELDAMFPPEASMAPLFGE